MTGGDCENVHHPGRNKILRLYRNPRPGSGSGNRRVRARRVHGPYRVVPSKPVLLVPRFQCPGPGSSGTPAQPGVAAFACRGHGRMARRHTRRRINPRCPPRRAQHGVAGCARGGCEPGSRSLHPENPVPDRILLSHVGRTRADGCGTGQSQQGLLDDDRMEPCVQDRGRTGTRLLVGGHADEHDGEQSRGVDLLQPPGLPQLCGRKGGVRTGHLSDLVRKREAR